jgi:Lar family restriction alleviation protein
MNARVLQSDIELKPCPFCGRTDLHIETDSEPTSTVNVFCDNPDCEASGPNSATTADEAAQKWNGRVCVAVPLDLLRRVLEQAESDNHSVEYERACNASDRAEFAKERDGVYELRRIAGIEG